MPFGKHKSDNRLTSFSYLASSKDVDMAEESATANQFVVKCSVRGHHVYKRIWTPRVGESLGTFCEEDNEHDKYAVAVHRDSSATIVGHIPREITRTCHFFLKSKGEITGEVSGKRRRCTAACGL